MEVEDIQVVEEEPNSRTADQSLSIARVDTCPACLGRDLCPEIAEGFLTVSMFGKTISYGQIYKVRNLESGLIILLSISSSAFTFSTVSGITE